MNKIQKIYLDTNHLNGLLDGKEKKYQELAELLKHNKYKFKLIISDIILTEQCGANKSTREKRARNAQYIDFSYIRNHNTIIQMEVNNFFNGSQIKPYTDNYFKVIKFPSPWLLSIKQKQLKFHQLLPVLPAKPLGAQKNLLYEFLNDRSNEKLSLRSFILEYYKKNRLHISQSNLRKVDEYTSPSLFFYFATWHNKMLNLTKQLSRNDAFDSAHCVYIPHVDFFATDKGNAHSSKQAIIKSNNANENYCQTQVFSKCEELLEAIHTS